MPDLAQFQIIRSPRRAEPDTMGRLDLKSKLIDTVAAALRNGAAPDDDVVRAPIEDFIASHGRPVDPVVNPDIDDQWAQKNMMELEQWLARAEDWVVGADVTREVSRRQRAYEALNRPRAWTQTLTSYQENLAGWIVEWLTGRPRVDQLATATRLTLVTSLAQFDSGTLTALRQDDVWHLLNTRMVMLPQAFLTIFAQARVQLIRAATVADLEVVRNEWRAYVPGEIAMIRNVMAGETYEAKHEQTGETETTTVSEQTTLTQTQRDDQSQDQTDLSREVQNQLQVAIHGNAQVQYEQTGPGSKISIAAGVDAGVQVGHNEQTVARIAHEVVTKAISNVESTTREARTRRELIRSTDTDTHGFAAGTESVRGLYRWVDRIDRYQIFTYPDRLQLEFELPEPAEYVRWRTRALVAASKLQAPPEWTVKLADITPASDVIALANRYHATGLPVLPDEFVSVTQSKAQEPKNLPDAPQDSQLKVPVTTFDLEFPIAAGYAAYEIEYSGWATPLEATWYTEYTTPKKDGGDYVRSFHTIIANVFAGTSNALYFQSDTTNLAEVNSIQGLRANYVQTQYGQAQLSIPENGTKTVALDPPATEKLTVTAEASGAGSLGITCVLRCRRTTEAVDSWRNAVYDALFSAWGTWSTNYQNAQRSSALTGTLPVGESSGPRNVQTVRDELKRQVVAWLLEESPFAGRKALLDATPAENWRQTDLDAARETAPTIQFMEQAFEWNNFTYIFYPYYWADRSNWDELSSLEAVDPDFERFLKAGSARVVVPVRPGMEAAVYYWIVYQKPFLGRPLPLPGHPMFVSIAQEIRDLTQPPADGLAGDSWDAQIGTTLLWLDTSSDLPRNPLARLGKPPHEPKEVLVPA